MMPIENIVAGSFINCKSTNDAIQGGRSCHLTHQWVCELSLLHNTGTKHNDCSMERNLSFIQSFTLIC